MPLIPTKALDGTPNGWVIPIWHADDGPPIEQVYLTVVKAGCVKGPHLHLKRRGLFAVVRGAVTIVTRVGREYFEHPMAADGRAFEVLPGVAAAIYNTGEMDAYVLNMPSPPWRADDQDEHDVGEWEYQR